MALDIHLSFPSEMFEWMHWLTKHTNKKRHSSVKKVSRQVIKTLQGKKQYCRNGSGEKKSETRLFQSTKHTSLLTLPAYTSATDFRGLM